MFTGFADDASDVDLALALDVIVPIQERLGAIFCAAERSPCRPTELMRIELADSVPSAAQLRLDWKRGALHRELTLRLLWSVDGWQADTDSLTAYLADCRAAVSEAASLVP
jgi:hypothetical protein